MTGIDFKLPLLKGSLCLLLSAAVLAGTGLAAPQKAKPAKPTAASKTTTATKPAAAPQDAAALEDNVDLPAKTSNGPNPPDGKWEKDEQGRPYYLDKLDKTDGQFRRLGGKMVRTRWGIPIEVVKEDEKFFYYKVYKIEQEVKPESREPSAEEVRQIVESYDVKVAPSRRLSFASFDQGLPRAGQWRNGFDIADMNKDGHPDIVHGPARKSMGGPSIFLNDGKGSWRRWSEAKFPQAPYDYGDAAAGDFDGDGNMDLALGVHLRGLLALTGDGKGTFTLYSKGLDMQYPGKGSDASGFSSRAITVADWNRDGRTDILALGEGPRLNISSSRGEGGAPGSGQSFGPVVYLNQPDGTWSKKSQGNANDNVFGDSLVAADFNGDGRPDFLTSTSVMSFKGLLHLARADGGWEMVEVPQVRPNAYVRAVAAADFDSDGKTDLALGYLSTELSWRTGVDVLLARDGGAWERRTLGVVDGRQGVTALAAGDLDGDGHPDLVGLTGEGLTWIFVGDGKGGFTREEAPEIPQYAGKCRGYHAEIADLDGDGRNDIVASFAGEGSPVYDPDFCPSGGGLVAWRVQPAAPQAP